MNEVITVQDLETLKKHEIFEAEVITGKVGGLATGGTIGAATNQVTGQVQVTLPEVLNNLGMQVQSWPSSVGGVLTDPSQIFLNDTPGSLGIGDYYAWGGPFPKTVSAGTDPATPSSGYILRSNKFIKSMTMETLRRSYAEAGYAVVGTFQTGFTIAGANDIGIDEATGKGYTGAIGSVPPGTDPTGGGFVDVSGNLLRDKLYFLEDFREPSDLDWTNAFERASQASKDGGFVVQCPQGELAISDSVTLYTATPPNWGEFYKAKGSRFVGHPRGTTIKKSAVSTKPVNAAVYLEGGRGLQWSGIDIIDDSAGSYGIYGAIDVSFSEFKNLFISTNEWGMYFNTAIYVSVAIEDIVFAAYPPGGRSMKNGVRIPQGSTSYTLKNIACFTLSGKAYVLSGSYCEIGPLACDDCAGVPYTFSELDASVSGLGVENISQPSSGTVIDVTASSSINIDVLSLHGVVQPVNTSLINYNAFGRIRVGSIRGGGGTTLNGRIANVSTNGAVEVAYINITAAQNNIGPVNVGNVAGAQYVQRYGSSVEFKYIRMPEAPQNDATVRYRIMGRFNGDVGCIGTVVEARAGSGAFPRSAMYHINCIGSGSTQYAIRVKQAVSEASSNNYNAWFTATYQGVSYVLCQLDTAGTRTLGSYFNGIVYGLDSNLFAVVTSADVTSMVALASGVIKTENAS